MIFAKKKFKDDEFAGMDIFPCFICFGLILLLGIIFSVILFQAKKKKLALLSIIISITIILSIIGWMNYTFFDRPNDIEYEIKIQTNYTGEYTLYVPYLDNSKLRSNLKIKSGKGKIEFIEVNNLQIQGSKNALKINGYENMRIFGKAQDDKWCSMSLRRGKSENHFDFHWVWCNKTNLNQNISIQITADIYTWAQEDEWKTTDNSEPGFSEPTFIYLNNGWNEIKIELINWIA